VVEQFCDIKLVIWQHPTEADHPKNSVRLLAACLPQIQIIRAEQLSLEALTEQTGIDVDRLELLFPDTQPQTNPIDVIATNPEASTQLLAIDGTWRKARKLLHVNPWLTQLPRRSINSQNRSRYHIRKAEREGQLSTLEAVCKAIEEIEGHDHTSAPILNAFDQYLTKLSHHQPIR
tara:strand:+ start:28049 stop:28576 length:528 start_codon:yes stop_codon:yes gene_type:complete